MFTLYNFGIQAIMILLLYYFSLRFSKRENLSQKTTFFLVSVHLLITIISCITSEGTHSDPPMYYSHAEEASSWFSLFGVSSTFIRFIIYPFINYFKFSYLSIFILFSFFSIYGYLLFYSLLDKERYVKVFSINVKYVLLFLPLFHLWMSFLGKDGITFMLTMLLIKEYFSEDLNLKRLIIYLFFLAMVRPYLIVFILLSYSIVLVFNKIRTAKKFLLTFGLLIGGLIVSFLIFSLLNIDIETYFSSRLESVSYYSNYKKEGSFIDPKTLNTLEKLFAYLFRPLFYDAIGIMQVYTSIENLLLILLGLKFVSVFDLEKFKQSNKIQVVLVYILIFLLVNSYLIYNLGLVNRQKYMIVPVFMYILFKFNSYRHEVKR